MGQFKPINDDHAVESVAFQLILDAPLGPEIFSLAHSQHARWREELPASNLGENDPSGSMPPIQFFPGAVFSYMRPDGTPAWQLRFEPQMITVMCGRYTRWDKIWSMACSLLERALSVVGQAPSAADRAIAAVRLQVTDKFEASEEGWAPENLFRRTGNLLPDFVFDAGPVWHNSLGWFAQDESGLTLNNLNVATVRIVQPNEMPTLIGITITHLQEGRLQEHLPLAGMDLISTTLEDTMSRYHSENKARIAALLVDEMCHAIGLEAVTQSEVKV